MNNRLNQVRVEYKKAYDIMLEHNNLGALSNMISQRYNVDRALLIIDEWVHHYHRDWVASNLDQHFSHLSTYVVPSGEKSKNMTQFSRLLSWVLEQPVERNTPIIVMGGGVVGDLGGFVAASALRGMPLIHVPTTLLAMVDSSIGGKTGINHASGKNVIGSFYQPDMVYADTKFLQTLPKQEWMNGLSEVLKYGFINDPGIFDLVDEAFATDDFAIPENWAKIILRSAQIKADIVSTDTLEKGVREYLNFGHTFAHAIENIAEYGTFSHGEAVFAGMYAACLASELFLDVHLNKDVLNTYSKYHHFSLTSLANRIPELIAQMQKDKKVKNQFIRLILLNDHGSPTAFKVEKPNSLIFVWETTIANFS